jgi:hypothetical protein
LASLFSGLFVRTPQGAAVAEGATQKSKLAASPTTKLSVRRTVLTKAEGLGLGTSFNTFDHPRRCVPRHSTVFGTIDTTDQDHLEEATGDADDDDGSILIVIDTKIDAHSFTVLSF